MSVVAVRIDDIAETQDVELFLTTTTCSVDREENRPCDTGTNQADDNENLEESKEKVTVKGVVFENKVIR